MLIQRYFVYEGKNLRNLSKEIVSLFQGTTGFNDTLQSYLAWARDSAEHRFMADWFYNQLEQREWTDHDSVVRGTDPAISISQLIANLVEGVYDGAYVDGGVGAGEGSLSVTSRRRGRSPSPEERRKARYRSRSRDPKKPKSGVGKKGGLGDTPKKKAGDRLRRARRRATARNANRPGWNRKTMRRVGPFGPVTLSRGRSKQANIGTRLSDYEDARVGSQYGKKKRDSYGVKKKRDPGFALVLGKLPKEQQQECARLLLRASKAKTLPEGAVQKLPPTVRRALAFFHHIVHQAEEEPERNPGSVKLARALLTRVAVGTATFDEFHGDDALFVPGREGGTGAMKEIMGGSEPSKDVAELEDEMSDSSDEDVGTSDYFGTFSNFREPGETQDDEGGDDEDGGDGD